MRILALALTCTALALPGVDAWAAAKPDAGIAARRAAARRKGTNLVKNSTPVEARLLPSEPGTYWRLPNESLAGTGFATEGRRAATRPSP